MAPNYREEEIAQNLNNIFAEDNKNVTISNIKSPTGDFTREIIIAALKESGFNLGKITKVTGSIRIVLTTYTRFSTFLENSFSRFHSINMLNLGRQSFNQTL